MREWGKRLGLVFLGTLAGLALLEVGLWGLADVPIGFQPAKAILRLDQGHAICFSDGVQETLPLDMANATQRAFLRGRVKDWFVGGLQMDLAELFDQLPHCVIQDPDKREVGLAPDRAEWVGLFGDSFAYGDGLPLERTLAGHLAALDATRNYATFARPGSFVASLPEQVAGFLGRIDAEGHQASHAIYIMNVDDILPPEPVPAEFDALGQLDLVSWRQEHLGPGNALTRLLAQSRIYWALKRAAAARDITRRTLDLYLRLYDPAIPDDGRKRSRQLLKTAHRTLASRGVALHVVIYPVLYLDEGNYPLASAHEKWLTWCREDGVDCVDASPYLLTGDVDALILHPGDRHPNGDANGLLAKALLYHLKLESGR